MKILIASTFVPPEAAGAEKVAWETAKRLAKDNEVHLLTTNNVAEEGTNIKIHKIPHTPLLTLFYSTLGRNIIKKVLTENKFDIIHSHMTLPWGFLFRNSEAKKVITIHGCEYLETGFLHRFLRHSAFKKNDVITSPSIWLKDFIKKEYGYNCKVIRNGIDTSKFRVIKGLKKEKNVVLFIGRLIEIKGIKELLRVAKDLKDYEFWFAGDGPLRSLINLPNTKCLGYLNDKGLVKAYNRATICVFPSYKENLPIVGLEALACGKAIVATKTGFSEIIKNNKTGLLINPKKTVELKSAIIKLMKNSNLRRKFEKNARKKSVEFDYKVIMKEYYSLYLDLLKN